MNKTKISSKESAISEQNIKSTSLIFEAGKDDMSKNSIIIEPTNFISSLNVKTIWEYRELIYFLALRDIKVRYTQTLLGVAWVVLQPIITTAIFTAVFLRLGQIQDSEMSYFLFTFSGFTLWVFINSAILSSSNSLINHSVLITKVFFPRLVIPISAVGATLLDLAIGLMTLFIVMLLYQVEIRWQILFVPFLIIPTLFLSLGLGVILAAFNVKYRDVKYILPFFLQLLLFASPVFYSLNMLTEGTTWMWQFNPLTGILENFRALLFGLPFDWFSFSISAVFSSALFLVAVFVFHRMEDNFADVI